MARYSDSMLQLKGIIVPAIHYDFLYIFFFDKKSDESFMDGLSTEMNNMAKKNGYWLENVQ